MRRICIAFLVSLCVVAPASSAFAQTAATDPVAAATPATDVPNTTAVDLSCAKPGVERPNCGVKPQQAGDRGGALQYTVWAILVAALCVVFAVVFRSAARTNRTKSAEAGDRNWS